MIPIPSGVRVWIATGHTEMRVAYGEALQGKRESLPRDTHGHTIRLAPPLVITGDQVELRDIEIGFLVEYRVARIRRRLPSRPTNPWPTQ